MLSTPKASAISNNKPLKQSKRGEFPGGKYKMVVRV